MVRSIRLNTIPLKPCIPICIFLFVYLFSYLFCFYIARIREYHSEHGNEHSTMRRVDLKQTGVISRGPNSRRTEQSKIIRQSRFLGNVSALILISKSKLVIQLYVCLNHFSKFSFTISHAAGSEKEKGCSRFPLTDAKSTQIKVMYHVILRYENRLKMNSSIFSGLRGREAKELLGSLSTDVFEPRTSTGSRDFSSLMRNTPFPFKKSSCIC